MNKKIRQDILQFLSGNGMRRTPELLTQMSERHGVSKQCISGNISFMTCKLHVLVIKRQGKYSWVSLRCLEEKCV